jgi:hypothetical protein
MNPASEILAPGDIVSVIADCGPSLVLLNGGFTVRAEQDAADLSKVVPIQSGPIGPDAWQAEIIATAPTQLVTLVVSVVCAVP